MKPQDPNDGESKQIAILSAGLTGIVCLVAITTVVVLGMRRRQNENSTKGKLSSNFVDCNQKKSNLYHANHHIRKMKYSLGQTSFLYRRRHN